MAQTTHADDAEPYSNYTATTDPGVTDDSDDGYEVGSRWVNITLDKEFVCLDATVGAAVWTETTGGGGSAITEEDFNVAISHATTDEDAGKAFTISSFPTHGIIKMIKIRANHNSGQGSTWTGTVNDGTGVAPADTSIAYDGEVGSIAVGDYIQWENEKIRVSAGTSTPLTVVRGVKGTKAAYHDDNTTLTKLNNGIRLVLYKNSSKLEVDRILELDNILTWNETTDAAISLNDVYLTLDNDVLNISKDDYIFIDDTIDEEAIVQAVNHNVINASFDYSITIKDALAAHDTAKEVYKQSRYDIPIPYRSAASTLYGTVFLDENIAATVTVTVDIQTDTYT